MNKEQKPEAHRLAEKLHDAINLIECGFSDDIATNDLSLAAMELESLHTRVQELEAKEAKPTTGELVMDVRCEGCGYMTHHREHMGCVRAAKQHTHPTPSAPAQPQADALDTERLDWLIEQGCSHGVVYEGLDKSFWMVWLDGHDAHKDKHQISRYHTAREAIDAAKGFPAAKENK